MVRALVLVVGLAGFGCGSGDAPPETKPTEAKVELTPDQVAYQQGPGSDPNYDPSEAASKKKR